ncbi:MAG: fibronectin type III domain-containing protein [Bacteroidetes bacterium]|uniref:Fibronectin type III domain-containing protein n=1 Tax=Candidatus Pullibacteroides excrementavium TaxID=2840905 RepID=A0A9D9DVT3_9BACT|nr:fibronectin type III domain-containing protein [Candidatus Pullibacteroides excrementavium]
MKKILTGLFLCAAFIGWISAQQVEFYDFTSEITGSYTSLEGGTVIGLSSQVKGERFGQLLFNETDTLSLPEEAGSDNPAHVEGIPLGFDFKFGGRIYDKFIVSGQGYLLFGERGMENITVAGNNYQLTRGVGPNAGIAIGSDVFGAEHVSFKVEGSSPNRILVVEFAGIAYLQENPSSTFNYQIRLFENDAHVEFLFDEFTVPEDMFQMFLGLKDPSGSTHYRTPDDGSWTNTSLSSNGATWCGGSSFEKGTRFIFRLPGECETPTESIERLALESQSDAVNIDVYADTTGYAEGYLILGSTEPIEGSLDGMEYAEGEEVLGATVVAVGPLTDFDRPNAYNPSTREHFIVQHEGLTPNTTYYYAAYLYNFQCSNAKYTEAVTAQIKTRPNAPDSLAILSLGVNEAEFYTTAHADGSDILIAATTVQAEYNYNRMYIGNFGLFPDDVEVGDTVWHAENYAGETLHHPAIVLYEGAAGASIKIPVNLEDNTIYYFGAFTKGEDGRYSSAFAPAYGITPAQIPFVDHFENMSGAEDNPFVGWDGTQGFELSLSGRWPNIDDGSASASFEANEEGAHQEAFLTLPPMDFPTDSNVLFHVSYSLDPWDMELAEGDSVVFEVSVDGGKTFEKIRAVHYQTAKPYPSDIIVSGHPGAEQAILRVRAVSYNPEAWTLTVNSVEVSGIAFCDVPSSLRGDSYNVVGGNVRVTWSPSLNEESEWNLCLARPDGEGGYGEWSQPEVVQGNSEYWVSGLADNQTYKVRVRAVCGPGNNSQWVEAEILSGRVPTFAEDFNNLALYGSSYYDPYELPSYWSCKANFWNGASDIEDTLSYSPYSSDVEAFDWKTAETPEPGNSNAAIAYHFNNLEYGVEMLVSPTIELIPEDGSVLSFDVAYGNIDEQGAYQALTEAQPGHRMELWVSVDSGRTFITTQPLKVWDSLQLLSLQGNEPVSIDLDGYEGGVAFALAFFGNSGGEPNPILWIDNFGVANSCPVARALEVDLNTLSAESAAIRWVADKTVDEWIVKLESPTATTLYTTADDEYTFSGLTEETAYMASVGHLCGTDTSAWASVEFTTPGAECEPISNLAVSNVTRNAATLAWNGEASSYRIRIKPVERTEWAYYTTEALTYIFSNLELETEYEGGVQSRCSQAASDTSEWVSFENFTTLGITCFAPTDFFFDSASHNSASFHWTGTSDKYQIEWNVRYGDEKGRMVFEGTSGTIAGLSAATSYEAKVRGICSAGDTSDWSEVRVFTTAEAPGCPVPTDLRVESVTENSATLLWSVEGEVEVAGFILRHRASNVQAWDSVQDIADMSYELTGLEPKTAYVWSVLSACADGRYSGWGTQTRFETEAGSATESLDESGLFLTACRHQIHVMNPSALPIERVRVYNLSGAMAEDYVIRSNENVILTTAFSTQVAVVEVLTPDNKAYRFKVMLP